MRYCLYLAAYLLGQAGRARRGITGLAGNHVALALAPAGPFVLLAHLRQGSARVRIGQHVEVGTPLGECGNSGNSTEPHLHLQAISTADPSNAVAVPITLAGRLPRNGEVVDAP